VTSQWLRPAGVRAKLDLHAKFARMAKNPALLDPGPVVVPAMELLLRQGYAATSVEELADASGVSRSTFFRKFGSKEDMVFADHERILARVADDLSRVTNDPLVAVSDAALFVFDQHVRHRKTTLLRNQLLRQVEMLRDRELVTTHRYERLFRQHLQSNLADTERRDYFAVAFAAAVVAVHNRTLRQWLREAGNASVEQLDKSAAAQLNRELRTLIGIFGPSLLPPTTPEPSRPAVVVTILDPRCGNEEILDAVRNALP
jgi:AcrR family transcriptional regulator